MARRKPTSQHIEIVPVADYGGLVNQIARLVDQARRETSRVVNSALTTTYWDIGRRIVEFEQGGRERAEYGQGLIERLADDLTSRLGRGFSRQNLWQMRSFYLGWEIHTRRRERWRPVSAAQDPGKPGVRKFSRHCLENLRR